MRNKKNCARLRLERVQDGCSDGGGSRPWIIRRRRSRGRHHADAEFNRSDERFSQGKFDIASTAFDNVLAWSGREGAEIVAVAQISDRTVLPVFVRPEIKNWSDLKGKKLAADAVDTAFALVLRRILLANGLDLNRGDYELVALGATGQRLESMVKGETYAEFERRDLESPFDTKAIDAGMRRIGDSREVLPDYPNTIFAVNREWGQKEPRCSRGLSPRLAHGYALG